MNWDNGSRSSSPRGSPRGFPPTLTRSRSLAPTLASAIQPTPPPTTTPKLTTTTTTTTDQTSHTKTAPRATGPQAPATQRSGGRRIYVRMPCYVQLGKKKGVIVGERGRRQRAAQTRVSHHANATRSSSTRGSRYGSMTPRQPELTSRDDHRWTLSCTHTSSHWGSKHGKPPQYRVPPIKPTGVVPVAYTM